MLTLLSAAESSTQGLSGERPSANRTAQPGEGYRGTEQTPLAVRIVENNDEAANAAERERRNESRDEKQLEAQQAATTAAFWQSAFGLVGFFLIAWSLYYTRETAKAATAAATHAEDALELGREANLAAIKSADAAVRGAEAAEASIKHNNRSVSLTLRAYISLVQADVDIVQSLSGEAFARYRFFLVNQGSTPAVDVKTYIEWILEENGVEPSWEEARFEYPSIVAPKQTIATTWGDIPYRSVLEAYEGRRTLHARFVVRYCDFLNNEPHETVGEFEAAFTGLPNLAQPAGESPLVWKSRGRDRMT
jgi:hypothetical protein